MCHVCIMVGGLEGPSLTLYGLSLLLQRYSNLSQMDEGDCVAPVVQPSFGNGNSEAAGKAIPNACRKCLFWPLLSEALPYLFPQGLPLAWWECPLVKRARETVGCF